MRFQWQSEGCKSVCAVVCVGLAVSAAMGQVPQPPRKAVHFGTQLKEVSSSQAKPFVGSFRELWDVHNRIRWFIVRNLQSPAGPGLMAMADESDVPNSEIPARRSGASLVIRPGDFLLIEEHTAAADLYLEGVALESAELGGTINARLKLAGKIVKVTAVERGKAALARRGEDQ